MDFLNQAIAQVSDLFRSMTAGARITAGLLLAVVVVSLAFLFQQQSAGGETYLLGGQSFSAAELSAMEAAFGKAGLGGYEQDGARIRIPRGQQAAYLAALADNGALPAHFGTHFDNVLDDDSPWTSPKQREERIKIAKQQELALIIRSMKGIENAAVHYDTKKLPGFRQESVSTASVSVKPIGGATLMPEQVPMIRNLVASAIAGLDSSSVTVIDLNGRAYPGGSTDGVGTADDDPYLTRVKEYQANYEMQILNALAYVRGVTVTANVELNKELSHVQDRNQVDPKNLAPTTTREETTSSETDSAANGGAPGLAAQSNTGLRLPAGGGQKSTENTGVTETQNSVGHDRTQIRMAALTPKRVTVAVGVPTSYFIEVWKQRNPSSDASAQPDSGALEQIARDEMDKIKAHVVALIPPSTDPTTADAAATPPVTVTAFQSLGAEPLPSPAITDRAAAWLASSWSTLGMFVLAGIGLWMLRSLARGIPAVASAPAQPEVLSMKAQAAEDAADEDEAAEPAAKPRNRLKRRLGSGPSLKDELADMVREDPDAAANILKSWIGANN